MPSGPLRFEVELTHSDIDQYHAATHRKIRGNDQGLSLFFVSRWLASPLVKADVAKRCPAGRFPVHVRQLSRRSRELQPEHSYTVVVDFMALKAGVSGVQIDYQVIDADGHCAASGEIELHFLEQQTLLEIVE